MVVMLQTGGGSAAWLNSGYNTVFINNQRDGGYELKTNPWGGSSQVEIGDNRMTSIADLTSRGAC